MYDHTHIASYRHWGARSAGLLCVWLLALDGRNADLAGGLSSNPILSGLRRTIILFRPFQTRASKEQFLVSVLKKIALASFSRGNPYCVVSITSACVVAENSVPGTFQFVSPENFREFYGNGKQKPDFDEDSEDEGKTTYIR